MISVIIPAKNEEQRLPEFLKQLLPYCSNSGMDYEIIIVDDGSTDKTYKQALAFQKKFASLKVLRYKKNRGKGFAIRRGFQEAQGDIIVFMDADGATPPSEIGRQLHWLAEDYDIVIGSREIPAENEVRNIKTYRRFIGRTFHALISLILRAPFLDTQCGFKMFTKKAINEILPFLSIDGFSLDLEILCVALKKDFKIKETAVSWRHINGSHIHFLWDPLKMLGDIFRIAYRMRVQKSLSLRSPNIKHTDD